MVDDEDRVRLIDFGIAANAGARRLTYANFSQGMGTPDYISPEQVEGKRGDARSDIYSLGVMLYEMLTGKLPFTGPNPLAVMNARLISHPEPPMEAEPSVTPVSYTHLDVYKRQTDDGLYCIGDQAAVIPSFTGDGISIALHTARCAAVAYLAAETAPLFQAKLRSALLPQMRLAEFAADGLSNSLARAVLPFCLRVWPGVMLSLIHI